MTKTNNLTTGTIGEEYAANYLKSIGYKILERNFHKRYRELDIVAIEGKTLVFVEVKSRKGDLFGAPEEAITPWKRRSLIQSAHYYKLIYPKLPDSIRIDVVSVYLSSDNKLSKIRLFRNITL
jgi:putative endonuclease